MQPKRLVPILVLAFTAAALPRAMAQGNDASTASQQGQTSAHPPPVLSTIEVTSVSSGRAQQTPPLSPEWRRGPVLSLQPAEPFALRSPTTLACEAIGEETARARCAARETPPAPPGQRAAAAAGAAGQAKSGMPSQEKRP